MLVALAAPGTPVAPGTEIATSASSQLATALWIDAFNPTAQEAAAVASATGITLPSESNLIEIETSSRLVDRDGTLYLSLPLRIRIPTAGSARRHSVSS